jgi:hypothetical protein
MKPSHYISLIALALIPASLPFYLAAQALQITAGTHLVMSGAPVLVLNNASLVNGGSFVPGNGTVLFTGDAPTTSSFIGGPNPILFYDLTIAKSANDLLLDKDAAVSGRITLSSGNLQLNNYTLDLGSSGSILGERNEARIMGAEGGTITLTAQLNRPQAINPGNIGVEITSPANLGATLITRGHVQQTDASEQTSIQRYYDISPEANAGLQASLRFYYLDGELAGKNKNELAVFLSNGTLQDWVSAGKDGYSATDNWVVKGGIDQLHRYTLAIPGDKAFASLAPAASAAVVFPNPAHDAFTLMLSSTKAGRVLVNLFDMAGHVLETKELYLQAGPNTVSWDIDKYPAGIYWLGFGRAGLRGAGFGAVKIVKQ